LYDILKLLYDLFHSIIISRRCVFSSLQMKLINIIILKS